MSKSALLLFVALQASPCASFQAIASGRHGAWAFLDRRAVCARSDARKHTARLVMKEPTPPPPPDAFEEEEEQPVRPRTDWSGKFKKALDTNPGRSERLGRTEQEMRYKQMLASNPRDVDALCGYACFLSTVKDDYAGAAELYSTAVRADPARARRITVQLWADLWAMRAEKARADAVKDSWRQIFEAADEEGRGAVPVDVVRAIFAREGMAVPEQAISAASRGTDKVYYVELAASLASLPRPSLQSRILAFFSGK